MGWILGQLSRGEAVMFWDSPTAQIYTNAVPSPYQPPTCAASSSDFPMKSEDALEEVGGW